MDPVQIDPYATLGVGREASAAEIARAYHRLAKALHPDLRGEATAGRMREVNAAWEILSDPGKRAAWGRGQQVVAAGSHWTPQRTPPAAAVRSAGTGRWTAWPDERRGRVEAAYPPRPRPGERRRTDSPWLVAAIGPAIIVAILIVAAILSVGDSHGMADRFEGFRTQEAFPVLNRAVAGTAIRLTFGVGGFVGYDLLADGSPASRSYPCENGASGAPDIQAAVNASGSSLVYSPANHAYVYTWRTDTSWAGSCRQLSFTFRDGSVRSVLFDFRA